ncbi:MAG TPA: hypothetical protein VIC62_11075, partial [Nakamurella sp.]
DASYPDRVPDDNAAHLSSARQAGQQAHDAGARHLMLTHLMPGTDHQASVAAAVAAGFTGRIDVAVPGHRVEL